MKIFVTHSRKQREDMIRLTGKLRASYPEDKIFYDADIAVGENWVESILDEIRKSDVLLFLVSSESIDSESCRLELRVAFSQLVPVLPVLIHQAGMFYWKDLPEDMWSKLPIRPVDLRERLDDERGFEEVRAEIGRLKTVILSASTITAQANTLAAEHRFREALMLLERRSNMSPEEIEHLKNLILREQAKHELSKLFSIPVTQTHLTFNEDVVRWLNLLGDPTGKEYTSWLDTANKVVLDRMNYEELQRVKAFVSQMTDLESNEKSPQTYQQAIALVQDRLKQNRENSFLSDFLAQLQSEIPYTARELKREIDSINEQVNSKNLLDLNESITRIDSLFENYRPLSQNREVGLLLEKLDSIRIRLASSKKIEDQIREQVLNLIEQFEKGEINAEETQISLSLISNRNPGFGERSSEYQSARLLLSKYQDFKTRYDDLLIRVKQLSNLERIEMLEKEVSQLESSRFYGNLSDDDKKRFRISKNQVKRLREKRPHIETIYRFIEQGEIVNALETYKTYLTDIDKYSNSILETLRAKLSESLTSQVNSELDAIRKAYAVGQSIDGDSMVQAMKVKYGKLV